MLFGAYAVRERGSAVVLAYDFLHVIGIFSIAAAIVRILPFDYEILALSALFVTASFAYRPFPGC